MAVVNVSWKSVGTESIWIFRIATGRVVLVVKSELQIGGPIRRLKELGGIPYGSIEGILVDRERVDVIRMRVRVLNGVKRKAKVSESSRHVTAGTRPCEKVDHSGPPVVKVVHRNLKGIVAGLIAWPIEVVSVVVTSRIGY
ncbi:MAG TPA: hypothetical protein VN985_02285 [Candidatus Eisenbacteria bacterium]|nr:hypothetical protein [Candidatus Eisenbacteria bacterium]